MIEVNLHPEGQKARRSRRTRLSAPTWLKGGFEKRDPWLIAAIAIPCVVFIAVGWLWLSQRAEGSDQEVQLAEAVDDSTRLADLRALSDSLLAREAMIRERLEMVRNLDGDRFVWPHIMDEISRALPDYTWFTAVRETSPLPDLSLQVDGLAANPLAITAFVRRLQASPHVRDVRILGSQQQELEDVVAQAFKVVVYYESPPDSLVRRRSMISEGL